MRDICKVFDDIKPQLLGYILDTLVKVLKWKKDNQGVELVKEFPRMADWAEWCEIIALCMREKEGQAQNHAQNDSADDTDDTDDTLKELVQSDPPKRPPAYET